MRHNPNKINELVKQYEEAETRRERRAIEDEILEETVWQVPDKLNTKFATFTREQFEKISAEVETDDSEVQRLLRKPHVKDS